MHRYPPYLEAVSSIRKLRTHIIWERDKNKYDFEYLIERRQHVFKKPHVFDKLLYYGVLQLNELTYDPGSSVIMEDSIVTERTDI
jgi:hypothetical protein